MSENISITVPMEADALLRASAMLSGIAEDITGGFTEQLKPTDIEKVAEKLAPCTAVSHEESTAIVTPPPEPSAAEVFAEGVAPTPEPMPEGAVPGKFELDVNGIPWDDRIHAGTKTKTVDGAWKNKRGIDKDLLASIEAELKGVMSIPATAEIPAAVVTEAVTPAPVVAPAPTPVPSAPETPAAPGNITTFPELMMAITAKGLEPQVVNGAIRAVGLASLPLLATRPDLIPQVAQRLGL